MRFGWLHGRADSPRALAFGNAGERVLLRDAHLLRRLSRERGSWRAATTGSRTGPRCTGCRRLAPERRGEALDLTSTRRGPSVRRGKRCRERTAAREMSPSSGSASARLATYARPAQRWTFFEIDPAIERIARTREYFSFMEACGDRCRVVIGDARVSLNRVPERTYDLLVLDAFSSDSIPMHLMTREAGPRCTCHASRLTACSTMHISNRHLRALRRSSPASRRARGSSRSSRSIVPGRAARRQERLRHWIVMARDRAALGPLAHQTPAGRV